MVTHTLKLSTNYWDESMPKGIEEWSDRPDYNDEGEPNE